MILLVVSAEPVFGVSRCEPEPPLIVALPLELPFICSCATAMAEAPTNSAAAVARILIVDIKSSPVQTDTQGNAGLHGGVPDFFRANREFSLEPNID
jgi:hypothetical protein